MDKKFELCCEPDASAVWRLLGVRGEAEKEMQKVLESELAVLRTIVKPVALVRQIRADEAFSKPVSHACGEGTSKAPARRMRGAHGIAAGSPFAAGEELLAVLLTAGTAGDYAAGLFAEGEHLRALVADAVLGAWLFSMDERLQEEIGVWCRAQGFGVSKRLEAPEDIPMELQRVICERLESERRAGVHVNDACMLVPEKSMCYLLRLDQSCGRFAMGHDCAHCKRKDCGMRFSGKEMGRNAE